MQKKRIVKDYEKLDDDTVAMIKMEYPHGFVENLITYTNSEGRIVSALPFETKEYYYLIRMTPNEAEKIIEEDEDYDEKGNLRDNFSIEDIPDDMIDEDDFDEEDYDKDNFDSKV